MKCIPVFGGKTEKQKKVKSLKELYKIGRGPSSSHTMGPSKAATMFAHRHPEADAFEVTLYGSLAATGKGHLMDVAIIDALSDGGRKRVDIVWEPDIFLPYHPNGMISEGPGSAIGEGPEIYDLNTIADIVKWCQSTGLNGQIQA